MKTTRREVLIAGAASWPWLAMRAMYAQGRGGGGRGGPARNGSDATDTSRGGPPTGRGPGGNADMQTDQYWIQALVQNREQIERQVKNLPDGVETVTETDNIALRAILVQHVESMRRRVETVQPIRQRDPLFREIFRHAQQIKMEIAETPRGLRVRETSNDPAVVKLIQQHAEVVNRFLKYGPAEVRKLHPVS